MGVCMDCMGLEAYVFQGSECLWGASMSGVYRSVCGTYGQFWHLVMVLGCVGVSGVKGDRGASVEKTLGCIGFRLCIGAGGAQLRHFSRTLGTAQAELSGLYHCLYHRCPELRPPRT